MINKTKIARFRNNGRWHSRGSDWATPPELVSYLDKHYRFTLDVCAEKWSAKHKNYYTKKDNALTKDWSKDICFMNPPYGKDLKIWMEKAFNEAKKGATVVCLVPSSTDTSWWHLWAMKGHIIFLRGRPRFLTKEGTWQQTFSSSVLVVFSPDIIKNDLHSTGSLDLSALAQSTRDN